LRFRFAEVGRPAKPEKELKMDNTTLIRVIAGALALVVLGIIIWRRKRQTID
jgi:LPXTG-motif cell wall-anchored protein